MIADNSTSESGDGEPNFDADNWRTYEVEDGAVSMTLVDAIADLEGVEACDLGFTLSEYVDPDALDRLFADRNETSVHFLIEEYDIYVLSPQEIRIRTS